MKRIKAVVLSILKFLGIVEDVMAIRNISGTPVGDDGTDEKTAERTRARRRVEAELGGTRARTPPPRAEYTRVRKRDGVLDLDGDAPPQEAEADPPASPAPVWREEGQRRTATPPVATDAALRRVLTEADGLRAGFQLFMVAVDELESAILADAEERDAVQRLAEAAESLQSRRGTAPAPIRPPAKASQPSYGEPVPVVPKQAKAPTNLLGTWNGVHCFVGEHNIPDGQVACACQLELAEGGTT